MTQEKTIDEFYVEDLVEAWIEDEKWKFEATQDFHRVLNIIRKDERSKYERHDAPNSYPENLKQVYREAVLALDKALDHDPTWFNVHGSFDDPNPVVNIYYTGGLETLHFCVCDNEFGVESSINLSVSSITLPTLYQPPMNDYDREFWDWMMNQLKQLSQKVHDAAIEQVLQIVGKM